MPLDEALAAHDPDRPTVGICFYRSHRITGNAAWVDELGGPARRRGGERARGLERPRCAATPTATSPRSRCCAATSTRCSSRCSPPAARTPATPTSAGTRAPWRSSTCRSCRRSARRARARRGCESASGLTPLDAATQVAIPEFDGRLLGGVVSFKERGDAAGSNVGAPIARYVADPERCARVARLAVRHARLRFTPNAAKRIAILLTSFPTKHARVGMAVGLDTPASALGLLDALHGAGYAVERPYAHGDELMHALIAGGGHDPEFVTDEQLETATLRLPIAEYERWYATLPGTLRAAIEARWGPPPGDQFTDGDDFVVAGLELGNVLDRDPAAARLRR